MVLWILIFLGLTVLLLYSLYQGYTFESLLAAFLILLAALGVLYRSFMKIKMGRFEALMLNVNKLLEENQKLKQKLGLVEEKLFKQTHKSGDKE